MQVCFPAVLILLTNNGGNTTKACQVSYYPANVATTIAIPGRYDEHSFSKNTIGGENKSPTFERCLFFRLPIKTQIFGYRQIRLLLLLSLPAATFGRCPRAPRAHHVLDVGTDVRVELREETEATGQWSGNKAARDGGSSSELWIMVNQAATN